MGGILDTAEPMAIRPEALDALLAEADQHRGPRVIGRGPVPPVGVLATEGPLGNVWRAEAAHRTGLAVVRPHHHRVRPPERAVRRDDRPVEFGPADLLAEVVVHGLQGHRMEHRGRQHRQGDRRRQQATGHDDADGRPPITTAIVSATTASATTTGRYGLRWGSRHSQTSPDSHTGAVTGFMSRTCSGKNAMPTPTPECSRRRLRLISNIAQS